MSTDSRKHNGVKHNSVKQRRIQIYEIQAGPELTRITVETPKAGETRVGVTVALGGHSPALDSTEVDVTLLGSGHFNPVAFPRPGALPELRIGGRAAAAAFRFEAVSPGLRALGLELTLRGRTYQIRFRKGADQPKARAIPASVAKVLPKSLPAGNRKLATKPAVSA